MKKRLLSLFLVFVMVLGMLPVGVFAEEVETPFISITTADGETVTATYKGMVPAKTEWTTYADAAYYHVEVPADTESVLVTYPADVSIAGSPSAYSYTLSIPDYALGYGSDTFSVEDNDDGTHTVTIPVANYLLGEDGTGTGMSLEWDDGTWNPITFFTFAYAEEDAHTCAFVQQNTDEKHLASAATCTAAATYYYSCECGEKGTETFASGDALGHIVETWTFVAANPQMHFGTCTVCSTTVRELHDSDGWTVTQEATCIEAGVKTACCTQCGITTTTTQEIAATGHSYADGSCTVCGEADPDYTTTSDAKIYIRSGNSGTGYTYTDVAELGETGLVLNNYILTLWHYEAYLVVKDAEGNNIEAEWSIDNTNAADVKDYSAYENYETGMTRITALSKTSGETGTITATLDDGTKLTLNVTATRFPSYITYTGLEGEDGNQLVNSARLSSGKCFVVANPGDEFAPITSFRYKAGSAYELTEEEMSYMSVKLNSDDETVAKVVDGKIQVVGEGTCNIWVSVTAYDSGILKEGGNTTQNVDFYHIIVYSGNDLLKNVSITDASGNDLTDMTVTAGESETAVINLNPAGAEGYSLTVTSEDTSVATVVLNEDNTVTVTGVAEGTAKIKVTYGAGSNPPGVGNTQFLFSESFTVTVEPSAHTCVFDQQNTDAAYLAAAATCTEAATYYYSCTCGEKGTETFTSGEALGHRYADGVCTVCGEANPDAAVTAPFTSIVTSDGKDVTANFVAMVPAENYNDGPYYHVMVPAGTESVLVTYPAGTGVLNDGAGTAWAYTLSVPGYELGYNSDTFALTSNDDGSITVTIPIANYLLDENDTGTAMSLEDSSTFDPVTFFTFEYEAGEEDPGEETTPEVTVYFSISHDDAFVEGKQTGEAMALKKITVPYFDLALYGLENYYFSSETYGDDGDGLPGSDLEPGTAEYAYGKITMLHLFLYATEVYYCGIDEAEAGQGYLYEQGILGTDVFNISGGVGSSFLNYIWDMDLNLNYYLNYEYPLASEGWGSTSDQILLEDGDIVTIGHFSNWSFFNDSTSIFNYMADGDIVGTTTANQGEQIELTLYHAGPNVNGDSGTAQTVVDYCPDVYYAPVDSIPSGNVTQWTYLGTAESDGTIVVDTSAMAAGQYIIAMAGQFGAESTSEICSTPGGIRLTVEGQIDYYAGYPFTSITADDSEQQLIDITEGTVDGSAVYAGEIPTYQVIIPAGTENVHVTFPAEYSFQIYTGTYDLESGSVTYGNDTVTVATNDDGSVTVTIPAVNYTDNGVGIILENESYQMVYGFDFVEGTPTVPGGSDETIAVTGVTLDKTEATVDLGDAETIVTLTATVSPENATNQRVSWSSSDENVATVSKGVVTAVNVGIATITVTTLDGGYTAEFVITVTDVNRPEQDEDGTFLISTAEELKWFADYVNTNCTQSDTATTVNAKLMNDIDLSSVCGEDVGSWTPIGDHFQGISYKGVFDGQGYTVSNFYMNENGSASDGQTYYRGFFGLVEGTTIKNLNLTGSITNSSRFVGGLVGCLGYYSAGGATVANCHVDVNLTQTGASYTYGYGGIAGNMRNDSSISNCSYSGTISGVKYLTGGIVGEASLGSNTINGCKFSGTITGPKNYDSTNYTGVGGIVGYNNNELTITNCYSVGIINCTGSVHTGGIIGYHSTASSTLTLNNVYSAAAITGEGTNVGGIAGYVKSTSAISLANAYYLDSIASSDAAGGESKTAEELKSAELLTALGDAFKKDAGKINNGYPVLYWEVSEAADLMGDVNMDGVIDTQDANLVVSYYYGSEDLTEEQLVLADVDGNGIIDTQDANLIVSYYFGTIDVFPAEG